MIAVGYLHNKISILSLSKGILGIFGMAAYPFWYVCMTVLVMQMVGTRRNALVTHITRILDSRRFIWYALTPPETTRTWLNFRFFDRGSGFFIAYRSNFDNFTANGSISMVSFNNLKSDFGLKVWLNIFVNIWENTIQSDFEVGVIEILVQCLHDH